MIHSIQSDLLYVEINDQGAELHSLFSKKTKTEYLWQGNPNIWNRRAPVLFPIVGRLKDGKYSYNGKTYKMPPHGFVSNASFTTTGTRDSSLILSYEDSRQTHSIYPFAFDFRVIFTLQWNILETIYEVSNKTNGPMYFSFGSHEGYRCPRLDGETFEDYFLEFDHDSTYTCYTVSPNGLLTEPVYPAIKDGRRLPLHYGLFENDSLVFTDIQSGKVALGSQKSSARLEIEYGDAPN
jgi:galactose mutarotase-like enzyme